MRLVLGVFQEFLKKDLGEQRYRKYCSIYDKYRLNKSARSRQESGQEVFQDLYELLKDQETFVLQKKMEALIESMCEAVNISRYYIFAFCFYLAAALFLIFRQLEPMVTIVSLLLMSGLFIYKTCEFVVNRYCYIDANIVLIYKSVLEQLIKRKEEAAEKR